MGTETEEEIPLVGGGRTAVWRRGNVVLRETGAWAPAVHALLNHLEAEGFHHAPRVVGSGFDERGREVLSFVEGTVPHPKPWNESALPQIGEMLRELHRATASFVPPDDAKWRHWHGRRLGNPASFGHCDAGPWNLVAKEGVPCALIDWEVAGPVDPIFDLAQACWLNAQLHDDDVAEMQGLAPLHERAQHLRGILDGYALPSAERRGFVDKMVEFAVHDSANQAVELSVTPETRDVTALWGITWRTRSAGWMLRHRGALQSAILRP